MKTTNASLDCLFANTPIAECGASPYYILASVWPLLIVMVLMLGVVIAIGFQTWTKPIKWDEEPVRDDPVDRARRIRF